MRTRKALSLKQSWAELVLQGRKTIELRKWNTDFRDGFLVHSSKIHDIKNLEKLRLNKSDILNGFSLGKARLVDVVDYGKNSEKFEKDKDNHLATKDWGLQEFLLKDVKRVKPIAEREQLNFWNFHRVLR